MYLERLVQINMATLATLGALLLGMGERNEWLPLVVGLAASLSVWLTDITARFCLSRWKANLLILAAAVISLHGYLLILLAAVVSPHGSFPAGNELQALSFARLLVYIQVILLFQRKDEWVYWLLVMLSLLQVVVATLFSQGIGFGFVLVLYMLVGFSAMTLLLFLREWQR